jgi:hypothetical protein
MSVSFHNTMSKKKTTTLKNKSKRVKRSKNDKAVKKRTKPQDVPKKPQLVEGEERKVHEEIIERRLGGGEPASAEKYLYALKEWHDIPGSMVKPPTDVSLLTKKRAKPQDNRSSSEEIHDNTSEGEELS